jgi:hypothetical protein
MGQHLEMIEEVEEVETFRHSDGGGGTMVVLK